MGAGGAKLSKTEEQLVDQKRYSREPMIPYDVRYGDKVRVYKQINSTQRVAIIQKVFDTQILYQATLDIQKVLAKLKHPSLIQLLNIVTKKKEQLCSQFYKVKFLYEYVDNDLQKDLENRRQMPNDLKNISAHHLTSLEDLKGHDNQYRIHYEENELWYIIASVIAVLSYLKERNLVHGDIRPFNLCLTSDNVLKVMTINSYIQTNWTSYMEKLEKLDTTSTYISPIQLGALQHNIQTPIHNVPKSDIFCLGVIILELCLLESAQDIYDFTSYSINLALRIRKIRELKLYSDAFIDFLISMLNLNENSRKSPEELFHTLLELAKQQQISISNRLYSSERVQLIVNKWKIKTQPQNNFNFPNTNQQQGADPQAIQKQNSLMIQQQPGYIAPEKIFEQQGGQLENNQTEDEMPNQEEGEIIQELGLLNKNENKDNASNSFSIQKSANNSPSKRHSEDNKNNISIQSANQGGQQNESYTKIRRDLSGEFKQAENKENIFGGRGNQNENQQNPLQRKYSQNHLSGVPSSTTNFFDQNNQNQNNSQQVISRSQSQYIAGQQGQQNNMNYSANIAKQLTGQASNNNITTTTTNMFTPPPLPQQQQQFGQSQFSNNQNMFIGSTGTFGGQQTQPNNNSLFGMQNFQMSNNNQNNGQQFNNANMNNNNNLLQNYLLLQMMQQRNNPQFNPANAMQNMQNDPQTAQLLMQLQQMQSQQQNQFGNNYQQNVPYLDINQIKSGNMYGNSSQQFSMSPTFNNQQNYQMNRAGSISAAQNNNNMSYGNLGGFNNNNNNNIGAFNQQGYNSNTNFNNNNNNTQAAQNQFGGNNNNNSNLFMQNNSNNNNNINNNNNTGLFGQNSNNSNNNLSSNALNKLNTLTGGGAGGNAGNFNQNVNGNVNANINANTQIQSGGGGSSSQTNLYGRSNRNIF